MSVLSASAARQQALANANYETKVARESFENGVSTAASLGDTQTRFEKQYFQLGLIMSEITAAGYVVTDEGTTWLVDWE
jgi:hypothetical protein